MCDCAEDLPGDMLQALYYFELGMPWHKNIILFALPCHLCLQEPYAIADAVPAVLRQVDADGDGRLSFEEFAALLQVCKIATVSMTSSAVEHLCHAKPQQD